MIFSSIEFLIFFLLFILLIKFFPNYQKLIIIISSLFFYSYWNPIFIWLVIFLLSSSYLFIRQNISLKISIPIVLLPLFYFKYSNFLISLFDITLLSNLAYKSELPLAISFITFTIIAIFVVGSTLKSMQKDDYFQNVALSLIASGAIGNAIDRIHKQSVTDFLRLYTESPTWKPWLQDNIGMTEWPSFNIAD